MHHTIFRNLILVVLLLRSVADAQAEKLDNAWLDHCKSFGPQSCFDLGIDAKTKLNTGMAIVLLGEACKGGHANGCYELAQLIEKSDPTRAKRLYSQSCDLLNEYACASYAFLTGKTDSAMALTILESHCGKGEAPSCLYLAQIKVESDLDMALKHYDFACKKGLKDGCTGAEKVRNQKIVARDSDMKRAFVDAYLSKKNRDRCDGGDLPTCNNVAIGLEYNGDKYGAVALLRKTCGAGGEIACSNLRRWELKLGNEDRYIELSKTLCEDAKDRDGRACEDLGKFYETSDMEKSKKYLRKAWLIYQSQCDKGGEFAKYGCESQEKLKSRDFEKSPRKLWE